MRAVKKVIVLASVLLFITLMDHNKIYLPITGSPAKILSDESTSLDVVDLQADNNKPSPLHRMDDHTTGSSASNIESVNFNPCSPSPSTPLSPLSPDHMQGVY